MLRRDRAREPQPNSPIALLSLNSCIVDHRLRHVGRPASSKHPLVLIGAVTLSIFSGETASAQRVSGAIVVPLCPATLNVEQTANSVPGWTSDRASSATGRLASMGFYDGPVSEGAHLRPNGLRKRGQITVLESDFDGHLRPIHLGCSYVGTDIILSRPLPASVRRCTITRDAMKPSEVDSVLVCR